MATNKKTTFKDKAPAMDDFDLNMDDFDFRTDSEKKDAKRKPIMKVAVNVGKGSLGHFTSQSFIRNTLGSALPAGYDTAIDTSYEISGAVGEAYNTAAQEWRKIAPSARRAVDRILPRAQSVLPKALSSRLEKFAKGGAQASAPEGNADEENLRSVLAELEQTTQLQHQKERAESTAKEELKGQIDTRRFNSSIKVMASMDARLANIQAFNDQAFARFQRRSLEIQYRSYFVQRDTLKLQGNELAAQRQLLQAIVHNTALPDMVKAKAREKYGEGLRERLSGASQQAIVDYSRGFINRVKDRVKGSIQNVGSGIGMGLQGVQMSQEQLAMMREMGMDVSAESAKGFGALLSSMVGGAAANAVGSGFRRSGPVAQGGAQLNRLFRNLATRAGKWSSSNTDFGDSLLGNLKGSALQMVKDHLGGEFKPNKRVASAGILSAGDPGMYSKRTQRSIEEIIPGYLSHILHELTMTRTGNANADRLVWNDDKSTFTTHKQQGKDVLKRVLNNPSMQYGRDQARDLADRLTAGAVLTPKAKHELVQDLMRKVMAGEELDPLAYRRGGGSSSQMSKETRAELRKAMAGRLRGANGKFDRVTADELDRSFHGLRQALPDSRGILSAYQELGAGDHLRNAGLIRDEGDDTVMDFGAIARLSAGDQEAMADEPRYSRDTDEFMGAGVDPIAQFRDRRVDLRKFVDGPIVVSARKVGTGKYRNATDGKVILMMHDVLLGVTEGGKLIASPKQVGKLVTPTGQTFAEWAAHNQRPTSDNSGWFARTRTKLSKGGMRIDDALSKAQQSPMWKKARSGKFRRRKVEEANAWAEGKTQHAANWATSKATGAADSIMAAAEAVATPGTPSNATMRLGLNTAQTVAQENLASLKAKVLPVVAPWVAKLKKKWHRAMAVKRYAISLHRKGELKPLIDAEVLKAGGYVSATTHKTITDMRDLLDGVKTKDGSWVASAEQVATELRAVTGEKFTELMDKVQAVEETVQATPTYQALAAHAATATQGVSAIAANVQAKVAAAATQAQSAATSLPIGEEPAAVNPLITLQETLEAFKEGNLERLEGILEAVQNAALQGTGTAGQGGYRSWLRPGLKRLVKRGANGLRWGARAYGKYVKHVFGGMGKLLGGAGRGVGAAVGGLTRKRDALGKEPADVYVKGDKVPRLTAGAMAAGEYFNENGSPIHVPADIKGPVVNADKTKTYISREDFLKGITDGTGTSLLGSALRGVGGALGTAAGWLGGYYGLVFRGAAWAASKAKNVLTAGIFGLNEPVDVYVKGDMAAPRLYATGMKAGSYVLVSNPRKKVRGIRDITGAVRDISDKANIVLTDEDLAKGIVDVKGRPFKVRHSLLRRFVNGAGALGEGYLKLLGSMAKGGAALASAPFKLMSWLFGGMGGRRGRPGKDGFQTADQRTHDLLTEMLHLLDARLPENENYRAGSWQEKMAQRQKAKAGVGADGKANAKNGLWGRLKGLFAGKKDEEEEEDKDGDSTYIDASGNRVPKPKKGTFGRNMRARSKRLGRKLSRSKLGRLTGRLSGKVANSGVGRLAGRVARSGTGRMAGRTLAGGGRVLAGAGRAALGVGRLGLMALGLGGTGALGAIGGGLATAGSAVAGGIGAAASGVGALAGAAGSGLAAAGTAVAGVLSLPVLLTIGAIAAVGTAAYFGYKFYSLKKKAPLRKLRMAQYGVDMNKEVMPVGKIQKLEELLLPFVIIGKDGKASIKPGADTTEIMKIFDLAKSWYNPTGWFHSKDAQDESDQKAFTTWLAGRFKPVFLNWVSAVHQVSPKMALSDCDSEMTPEQKRGLLKSVYGMDASVYSVMASPFGTDPLTAGKKEVDAAYAEALKDLPAAKTTGDGKKPLAAAAATAMVMGKDGKPVAASSAQAAGGITKAAGAAASATAAANAMKPTSAKGTTSRLGLTSKGDSKQALSFIGGTVSALKAVRFKTYGLVEMLPEQVKAVYLLETELMRSLDYDSKGTAKFTGDAGDFYTAYTGYFGISPTDEVARVRWFSWFAKRFLPTLLTFCTAVKHINKATDPFLAEDYLAPQSILDVANMVVAATYTGGMLSSSVWTYTDSPFSAVALNSDSGITRDNIQALKNAVKKRTLDQETASKGSQTRKDIEAAGSEAQKQIEASKEAEKKSGFWGRVKNVFSWGKDKPKAPPLPPGAEAGSNAAMAAAQGRDISVGQVVAQPGNGTVGDVNKLPMPAGSGQDAVKALLEAVGAMTGVDPKVLNTFAGIESSWDPTAHAPNGSAAGLFQFIKSTWSEMLTKYGSKYGLNANASRMDPRANALMGAEYLKQNQSYMAKSLGRAPTDVDLYLAHFLGAGGAAQFAKAASNALGAAINPSAASANMPIFARNGQWLTKAGIMKVIEGKVAKFRSMGNGMTPAKPSAYAAAATGGNTTTTANGPKGGVGATASFSGVQSAVASSAQPSAGAKALASIVPPGSSAPPSMATDSAGTSDPVVQAQAVHQQRAVAADRQAQSTMETQQAQMGDLAQYLKNQTALQQQMVDLLQGIHGFTGNLPAIAAMVPSGAVGGNPDNSPDSRLAGAQRPTLRSAELPKGPISVQRKVYDNA